MRIFQAPTLPDPASLKDLPGGLGYAFLATAVILALLFYFGGNIRDSIAARQAKKNPSPPAVSTTGQLPAVAPAPQAGASVDRAEQRTDMFIDTLLRQIQEGAAREDDLERQRDNALRELDQMRQENRRLDTMLWQQQQRRL